MNGNKRNTKASKWAHYWLTKKARVFNKEMVSAANQMLTWEERGAKRRWGHHAGENVL